LWRLIELFSPNDDERNNDNEIRRIRRINRVTMEKCMRLIQMAGATMNTCMQLKGCNKDFSSNDIPVTGGNMQEDNDVQLVWWTLAEWIAATATGCTYYGMKFAFQVFFFATQFIGMISLVTGTIFLLAGPLLCRNYG